MADIISLTGKPIESPVNPQAEAVAKVMCNLPHPRDMDTLICIGWRADGSFYFDSSAADGGTALWLLETARNQLMMPPNPCSPTKPKTA